MTSAFLDGVHSFGAKVAGEDDPYFNICHRTLYNLRDNDQEISERRVSGELTRTDEARNAQMDLEFCYILRYFERHGRSELKQAWSLRQTLIYQKYDLETQRMVWIVIQPMQKYKTELESHKSQLLHPMTMHSISLSLGLSNWRWYLDDTRKIISQYVSTLFQSPQICKILVTRKTEKASYSSLGSHEHDYDTDFTDAQRLQTLCSKLNLVTSILSANMDIAQAIKHHCHHLRLSKPPNLADDSLILTHVNLDIQRLRIFKRTALALQAQAQGTSKLARTILPYSQNTTH